MGYAKRIALFLAVNFLVVITLSIILNIFHLQPFLQITGSTSPRCLSSAWSGGWEAH